MAIPKAYGLPKEEAHAFNKILEKVSEMCLAEARGEIKKAERCYEYLLGFCEVACGGINLENAITGAAKILRRSAVGTLDYFAYNARCPAPTL